jgi:hypothetical protein
MGEQIEETILTARKGLLSSEEIEYHDFAPFL